MCAGMLLARQRLSDEAHLPAALADLTVARVHLEFRSGDDGLFAGSAPLATAPVSMHISAQRLESKFIPIAPGSQTGERPRPAREFLACIGYSNNARGRAQRVFDMRRCRLEPMVPWWHIHDFVAGPYSLANFTRCTANQQVFARAPFRQR